MRRFFTCSFFLFAFLMVEPLLQAQPTPVKESLWKGFKRYDFEFEQRNARLIVPWNALPGNPWLWRARFPDWHTQPDSILVKEGFHIAYINTNDLFGSPEAMDIWDKFYRYLVEGYHLDKKVALSGVSRGGLFVYNWAKRNPKAVACIYAEAPVCDFNSWPAGFGAGEGSTEDWIKLKETYGFASEQEAKAYADNPIDNLGLLAAEKVPVLHMIGLKDKVVPPEENTFILVDRYVKLGGTATIIPCTNGKQELQGHHFPIETPRIVADFIKYHAVKNRLLATSGFHQMRGGLQNSRLIFERKNRGRVAFLGGSITYNPGWRDSVSVYLQERFPETEFDFIAAGIPSMGSVPGAFRLERDVLYGGPIDLVFEEAAVNDRVNNTTSEEQIRGMEGIVRHIRTANPSADIVMMHFADREKLAVYHKEKVPEVIQNHEKVAIHYNIPSLNLAKEVGARIANGEFTWEEDFKSLHPSPFGQQVYASSIIQFLESAFSAPVDHDDKIKAIELPEKLDPQCYDKGYLMEAASLNNSGKGWHIVSPWNPEDGAGTRPDYVNVPILTSEDPGSKLKINFSGKAIGIAVAAGPDAGIIEYRLDKGDWKTLNLFTPWSKHLHLPWYYTLAAGLANRDHRLEIRIAGRKDQQSNGHACRIRYFFINRHQTNQ